MVVRVWEILDANENARTAYLRILSRPTRPDVAQNAICLLLWLEKTMGFDIFRSVAAMAPDNISLVRIVFEANALCTYVLHGYYALPPPFEGFPGITSLCGDGRLIDHRFFRFHKDLVARGVTMIRETVAALVFNDSLHALLRLFEDDSNSPLIPNPVPAPELMAPFIVTTTTPPEDSRTVFVAFPEWHPLSSLDIKDYFERTLGLGHCIERIATERPCTRQSAKHGVVVFRSAALRDEAMHGEAAVYFRVDGREPVTCGCSPTSLPTRLIIVAIYQVSMFASPYG